ncbi:MAG: phasin family protein [Acidobacteriota bacterium]
MSTAQELNDRLNKMGTNVRDLGRDVWLAGLGAVGTLDERRREVFTDLVDRGEKLVERGEKVDGKIELEVMKPVNEVADRVKGLGARVERRFEDGMASALHRLGMPARNDVEALIERVERLTEKVEGLAGQTAS